MFGYRYCKHSKAFLWSRPEWNYILFYTYIFINFWKKKLVENDIPIDMLSVTGNKLEDCFPRSYTNQLFRILMADALNICSLNLLWMWHIISYRDFIVSSAKFIDPKLTLAGNGVSRKTMYFRFPHTRININFHNGTRTSLSKFCCDSLFSNDQQSRIYTKFTCSKHVLQNNET